MKRLLNTSMAALLITTQLAHATVPHPPQEPPEEPPIISEEPATESRKSGGGDGMLAIGLVIGAILLLNMRRDDEPNNCPIITDQTFDSEKLNFELPPEGC